MNEPITITLLVLPRHADETDCLEAMRDEIRSTLDLDGWDVGGRYTDDNRESASFEVPAFALPDGFEASWR